MVLGFTRVRWTGPLRAVLLVAGLLGPGWASAGQAANPDRKQPMQVVLVHDARPGCGGFCSEWVSAQGKIDGGTPGRFDRALRRLGGRRVPVFIDSVGGSVDAAIAVGRSIRAKHLDVVVTRTSFDPCAPADAACRPSRADGSRPGHPHGLGSVCASACVLILAAGEKREAASWTYVGVHQIVEQEVLTKTRSLFRVVTRTVDGRRVVLSRTLVSVKPISKTDILVKPPRSTYDRVAAYLGGMGIGAGLMPLMLATPHEGIHWLNAAEEAATGIVTSHVDGELAIDDAFKPDPPPAPAATPPPVANGPHPEHAVLLFAAQPVVGPLGTKVGDVAWTFDDLSVQPGDGRPADLRAAVTFPDLNLSFALRIEPTGQPGAAKPYRMVITVAPPPFGPVQGIDLVGLTWTGTATSSDPDVVLGTVSRTGKTEFEIGLSGDDFGRLFRRQPRTEPSFAIHLTTSGYGATILSFERAPVGEPVIEKALKVWASSPGSGADASKS